MRIHSTEINRDVTIGYVDVLVWLNGEEISKEIEVAENVVTEHNVSKDVEIEIKEVVDEDEIEMKVVLTVDVI